MYVELTEADDERLGGKGAGLARLIALGLPVPPAVVVPPDAHGRIEGAAELAARLGEPLAVRSSAVGEDAHDRSAAGQFETRLDVRAHDLAAAVAEVYESTQSDRARAYGGGGMPMAVVVQRQVQADRAGVAFSVDPVTGAQETAIESVFGLGESLVSGVANPDRYWVARDDSVRARVAPRDGSLRTVRCLRDDEARRVAALVRQAADGFGCPVDVEFCFERGELWLVQCRAITTV